MTSPTGWQNPIIAAPGLTQMVDAALLLPSRVDLVQARLTFQRALLQGGTSRLTPIQVTPDGVIWDGQHGARAAAERGFSVTVLIVDEQVAPVGVSILQLPVR